MKDMFVTNKTCSLITGGVMFMMQGKKMEGLKVIGGFAAPPAS